MKIFVLTPKGLNTSHAAICEIGTISHEVASSTQNAQAVIVQPLDFCEEIDDHYKWEVDDYQRGILNTLPSGVPIMVHDEGNDSFYPVISWSNNYTEDRWILTGNEEYSLEELISEKKSDPWTEIKKNLGLDDSSLSGYENEFIDVIMKRDADSFINKPVEPVSSFTATSRTETSFLSEENEML